MLALFQLAATGLTALIRRMTDLKAARFDNPGRRVPWLKWLLLSALLIAAAHLLDPLAWASHSWNVKEQDWVRLLRIQGFLPTWLVIAGVWWLDRVGDPRRARGTAFLVLAPTLGGIAAELLKLVIRRLRPPDDVFGYAFRSFSDRPFHNGGLGMPSSHVLVAFSGAFALARMYPRARWVFYSLAAGCAATRVVANRHYLSDTVAAACIAWMVVELTERSLQQR